MKGNSMSPSDQVQSIDYKCSPSFFLHVGLENAVGWRWGDETASSNEETSFKCIPVTA